MFETSIFKKLLSGIKVIKFEIWVSTTDQTRTCYEVSCLELVCPNISITDDWENYIFETFFWWETTHLVIFTQYSGC